MPLSGRSEQDAIPAKKNRQPAIWLLAAVACAYFGFHALRDHLPAGIVRSSFPSLLAPLGMFGVIDLLPGVRFHSRHIKWLVLGATTLVAACWLEAVVPTWTRAATGSWQDALAMGIGYVLFCLFDSIWGNVGGMRTP